MIKVIRGLGCVGLITFIACSYPEKRTYTPDSRPRLAILGAPADAVLYIDGLKIGPAKDYDGKPNALAVLSGQHLIEVKQSGHSILERRAYFSDELKEIRIGGEQ